MANQSSTTTSASPESTAPTYFIGVWGNNTLTGYGANEVFYSPGGNGVMTGAGAKNTYIADGNTQQMEVTNFDPSHDLLNIYSSTGVSSLSALLAHTKTTASGLEIDFASGSKILLDGVKSLSALTSSDVVFSQGAYTPPNTNVALSALTSETPTYIVEKWGSHNVTGAGSTEVFFAPGGIETLTGGGNKNIYVVDSTTQKMEITNFNPSHDVLYIGSSSGVDSMPTMVSHLKLSTSGFLEIDLPSGAQIVFDGVRSTEGLTSTNVAFFAGAFTPPADSTTPTTTSTVTATQQAMITGTSGNDVLKGEATPGLFYGNGGSDVMTGGSVHNVFIVDNLNHRIEITNFNPSHDRVYIGSSTGVTDLTALLATGHATSQGAYEFDTPSGTSIVFGGMTSATAFSANDISFFSGTYASAKASPGDSTTSTHPPSADAATSASTPLNVERLQLSDESIAYDIAGNAGQVYRLYQAAFNRTPDKGGLGDWIYGMDTGMSLLDVSAGFVGSAEFKSVYGQSPTDSEVVTGFYQNVLHRAPEQTGYDYWMNQLQSGVQTRTQVLAGFSESAENQAQVIGVIQNGIEYTQHVG